MISAASLRFQDYQFEHQTLTGLWRWTTRVDVTGPAPVYQIRDIMAPFGILRDTVPLPGPVVQAMADSISQLQLQFPPTILIGPPSSLTFVVDEGRGFSIPQTVVLTNSGVFGSLLSAVLSSNAVYCTVTPSNVGNLASNESGSFDVAVDSTTLLASSSPYHVTVSATDPSASNNPRTLPVTITVRPKATIQVSPSVLNFAATRPPSGPFDPVPSQTFAIQNSGLSGSVLDFQVQKLVNLSDSWLTSLTPVSGTLSSGGSQNLTVGVAPVAGLMPGSYTETLRISGYSTNSFVDVTVQLVIS